MGPAIALMGMKMASGLVSGFGGMAAANAKAKALKMQGKMAELQGNVAAENSRAQRSQLDDASLRTREQQVAGGVASGLDLNSVNLNDVMDESMQAYQRDMDTLALQADFQRAQGRFERASYDAAAATTREAGIWNMGASLLGGATSAASFGYSQGLFG